jgi:hypothetical protein
MTKEERIKRIVETTDRELAEHSDYAQAYAALSERILSRPKFDHVWEGRYKKPRAGPLDHRVLSFATYKFEA